MENALLSIVIPVYNVEGYLHRCIDSILAQSFHDFEIICVDDGSTDMSGDILEEYSKNYSFIKVIHQVNAGVSAARNEGLRHVNGKYLTFIDPDDFLSSDTYEGNIRILDNDPELDFVQFPYCHYIDDHSDNEVISPNPCVLSGHREIFGAWWSGIPLEYVIWNKIYRTEFWDGVEFRVGHVSEDTSLVAIFGRRARKVRITDCGMYFYQREREDSYTFQYSFQKHIDLFEAHCGIYEIFADFSDMTEEKVQAFTRIFRRLIQAKEACPEADTHLYEKRVSLLYPKFSEIFQPGREDMLWLISGKLLGVSLFVKLFLTYLKCRKRICYALRCL